MTLYRVVVDPKPPRTRQSQQVVFGFCGMFHRFLLNLFDHTVSEKPWLENRDIFKG
jgi:hypothetical protein